MDRRKFLLATGGFVFLRDARATPEEMSEAIRKVTGGARLNNGRISLDLPSLVENGSTVPMTVKVESPMTPENYVRAIHVFNEKNPQPNVAAFRLSPRCGRAEVHTRVRLADSQKVTAICEMSDGSFWSTAVDVIVTLAACTEMI